MDYLGTNNVGALGLMAGSLADIEQKTLNLALMELQLHKQATDMSAKASKSSADAAYQIDHKEAQNLEQDSLNNYLGASFSAASFGAAGAKNASLEGQMRKANLKATNAGKFLDAFEKAPTASPVLKAKKGMASDDIAKATELKNKDFAGDGTQVLDVDPQDTETMSRLKAQQQLDSKDDYYDQIIKRVNKQKEAAESEIQSISTKRNTNLNLYASTFSQTSGQVAGGATNANKSTNQEEKAAEQQVKVLFDSVSQILESIKSSASNIESSAEQSLQRITTDVESSIAAANRAA